MDIIEFLIWRLVLLHFVSRFKSNPPWTSFNLSLFINTYIIATRPHLILFALRLPACANPNKFIRNSEKVSVCVRVRVENMMYSHMCDFRCCSKSIFKPKQKYLLLENDLSKSVYSRRAAFFITHTTYATTRHTERKFGTRTHTEPI